MQGLMTLSMGQSRPPWARIDQLDDSGNATRTIV